MDLLRVVYWKRTVSRHPKSRVRDGKVLSRKVMLWITSICATVNLGLDLLRVVYWKGEGVRRHVGQRRDAVAA